jgi:hypothetical protein
VREPNRWLWRICVVAGVLAVLAAVGVNRWPALAGGVAGSGAVTGRDAPCLPGRAVPVLPSPHVSREDAGHARYNSVPPTSGPHFPFAPAPGVYTDPLPDGLAVHALEHGHVNLNYAPGTPDATVRQLTRLARRYPTDVLLAPYPKLDKGIALTAWGRIDGMDGFDEERAVRFIEQLRGRYDHGWVRPDPC